MYTHPLYSLIHRKLNDSATVAAFWQMFLYSVEMLDGRFLKIHSTMKQNHIIQKCVWQ